MQTDHVKSPETAKREISGSRLHQLLSWASLLEPLITIAPIVYPLFGFVIVAILFLFGPALLIMTALILIQMPVFYLCCFIGRNLSGSSDSMTQPENFQQWLEKK